MLIVRAVQTVQALAMEEEMENKLNCEKMELLEKMLAEKKK